MLQRLKQVRLHTLLTGLVVALASTFLACDFHPPTVIETPEGINEILNMAPVRSLSEGDRWTVYEVPGKIRVQHGFGCVEQGFAATEDYLGFRIQDMETVPREFGDAGTIILNGWDLQFTNGDHHVLGLGTVIFNITQTSTPTEFELRWEAGGVLSDKNGDDGYKWCYRYTLVFWMQGAFEAVVPPQEDVSTTFVHSGSVNGTALSNIPGAFTEPSYGPRAVLPRGFGLSWEEDHHVFQVGFDLGTPPLGGPPVVTGNDITWTSQTILKDNDTMHHYNAAQLVTILSGQNVEIVQPRSVLHWTGSPPSWVEEPTQLVLQPAEPTGCDYFDGWEERQEFYSVPNVQFDYAIPVLTGWDLQYGCKDHEIERIGVYLVEFEYVKEDPNDSSGTLNYTIFSTMRDDSDNGHAAQYKVSILGLKGMSGGSEK